MYTFIHGLFSFLLQNTVVSGGLEKVRWHQQTWIDVLQTHPRPLSKKSTTVLAGLIRPFFIQIAPRRSDLKALVPYLQTVKCSRGDILFHDNHQRPKKTERYWYIVCRGECSVQTWEIEDIIRKRHAERQEESKKRRRGVDARGGVKNGAVMMEGGEGGGGGGGGGGDSFARICRTGDSFGAWSSADRRRTVAKCTADDTIVMALSEMHVDDLLLPLITRKILHSRNFLNFVEISLSNNKVVRLENFTQVYELGRALPFVRDLSTEIRNRFLHSSCRVLQTTGVVWKQNDHASFAVVLLEGEMVMRMKSGMYKRVNIGQMCGETCFSGWEKRFCTLETAKRMGHVKLLAFGTSEFMHANHEHFLLHDQLTILDGEHLDQDEYEDDDDIDSTTNHAQAVEIRRVEETISADLPSAVGVSTDTALINANNRLPTKEEKEEKGKIQERTGESVDESTEESVDDGTVDGSVDESVDESTEGIDKEVGDTVDDTVEDSVGKKKKSFVVTLNRENASSRVLKNHKYESYQQLRFHTGFPMPIPLPVMKLFEDDFHITDIQNREQRRKKPEWCQHLPIAVEFLSKLAFFKQFLSSTNLGSSSTKYGMDSALKLFALCVGYLKIPAYGMFILEEGNGVDQTLLADLSSTYDFFFASLLLFTHR